MAQGFREKTKAAFEKQLMLIENHENPDIKKERMSELQGRFIDLLSTLVREGVLTWNAFDKISEDLEKVYKNYL